MQGYEWTHRDVVQNGVVVNTYRQAQNTIRIVINYTSGDVIFEGVSIPALSAAVLKQQEVL